MDMHSREEKIKAFEDLLDVMDALREKCPWNAAQTMESIRPMTEEEVYELSDAIVRNDSQEIAKELGDLLYHIVFYTTSCYHHILFYIQYFTFLYPHFILSISQYIVFHTTYNITIICIIYYYIT